MEGLRRRIQDRSPWLAISAVAIGLAVVLLLAHDRSLVREREALARELASFIVPPISVGTASYRVEGGAVQPGSGPAPSLQREVRALRLARYALLARIDPLFGLSGVDTARLEAAARMLEERLDALAASGQWGPETSRLKALHPVAFLKTLPELEELRRNVASSPSLEISRRYQEHLEASIRIAATEVAELYENVAATSASVGGVGIFYLGSSTDRETVLRALKELETSFKRLQREAEERGGCLYLWRPCGGTLQYALLQPASPNAARMRLDPEVETLLAALWQWWGSDVAPQVFWVETPCFGKAGTLYPFQLSWRSPAIPRQALPGWDARVLGEIPDVSPLDTLYFFPMSRLPVPQTHDVTGTPQDYSRLTARHYEVVWQSAGNYYTCPDLGHLARVTALYAFADSLADDPLFRQRAFSPDSALAPALRKLGALEEKLVSDKSIAEPEVTGFATDIVTLLSEAGEARLAEVIGEEAVLRGVELIGWLSENAVAFDDLVAAGALRTFWIQRFNSVTSNPLVPARLLLSDSYPSLYFLPFNASFLAGSPPRFTTDDGSGNPAFLKFDEMNRRHTIEAIAEIMKLTLKSYYPL